MINDNFTLAEIVSEINRWSRGEDGVFVVSTMYMQADDEPYEYPIDAVRALHPVLPEIIDAMILREYQQDKVAYIHGMRVYTTLALLTEPCIRVTDVTGQARRLTNIHKIEHNRHNSAVVHIGSYDIATLPCDIQGKQYEFVTDYVYMNQCVSIDELEKHYPGWELRWRVGKDLGVPMRELIHEIFREENALAVTMPVSGLEL